MSQNYIKLRNELSYEIVKKTKQLVGLLDTNIDVEDRIELYGKYFNVLQKKADEFLAVLGIHLNDSLKKEYVDPRIKYSGYVKPSERFSVYNKVKDVHNGKFLLRHIDTVKGVLIALDYIKLLDGEDAPIEEILIEKN